MRRFSIAAWRYRELGFGLLAVALAVAGLLHIRYGSWRPGPGGGNALVPMVAYWVLLAAGAGILLARLRAGWQSDTERLHVPLLVVAGSLVWGAVFFLAVRNIGLAVSASVLLGGAMLILSPRDDFRPGLIAVVALAAGAVFWLLFTRVAPILVSNPVLF
jgi:hypothetical protein